MADWLTGDWLSGDWSGAGGASAFPAAYYQAQSNMFGYLRQATAAQIRATPPFLDDTDFKTAETALTIANTDVKLVVNGGASADKNSGGGTHRINGVYGLTFDATDTATVGELEVSIKVAGALPVFMKFTVLEEAVYDAMFAASAVGYATESNATSNVGDVLSALGGIVGVGQMNVGDTGNDTTHVHLSVLTYSDDEINDWLLCIYDTSASEYHWRWILDFVGSSRLALVAALPFTPVDTDFFWLLGARRDVDAVKVGGQTASAAATVTFPSTIASTTNITAGTITTATNVTTVNGLASGVITATSIAADAIGASELAADAATEIATAVWAIASRTLTAATNITSDGSAIAMSSSGVVGTVNLANTLTTYTGNTVQTGDSYAIVNSGTNGLAVIRGYVDDIGVAGAGLTAIPTMTTAMTESYNADGAAPTPAQALFFLMQMFSEITVSSTTATIKKLDGSTTAYTLTLNDASTPTSITRAT